MNDSEGNKIVERCELKSSKHPDGNPIICSAIYDGFVGFKTHEDGAEWVMNQAQLDDSLWVVSKYPKQ